MYLYTLRYPGMPQQQELLDELRADARDEQATDVDTELRRVNRLYKRLNTRLEEVDAVLGANPC